MNAPFAAKQFFVVIAQSAAFDLSLSHAAFRLLAVIQALKDGETGITTASLHYLADQMGYNGSNRTRSVSDLLSVLIERGYLIRVAGGIGRQSSSYYHKLDNVRPSRNPRIETGAISPPQTGGTGPSMRKSGVEKGGASPSQTGGIATPHKGGSTPSSLIRLDLDASDLTNLPAPSSPAVTVTPDDFRFEWTPPVEPVPDPPAPASAPAVRQRQPIEKHRRVKPEDDTAFVAFWSAYPRKVGKPLAARAFAKALEAAGSPQRIADALHAAKRSDRRFRGDGQFIPHPTSWLNASPWDDEHTAANDERAEPERLQQTRRGVDALRAALDQHTRSTISVAGAAVSGPPHLLARIANGAAK